MLLQHRPAGWNPIFLASLQFFKLILWLPPLYPSTSCHTQILCCCCYKMLQVIRYIAESPAPNIESPSAQQNSFYDVWHILAWSAVLQRLAANFACVIRRQVSAGYAPKLGSCRPATVKTTTGDRQQSYRKNIL